MASPSFAVLCVLLVCLPTSCGAHPLEPISRLGKKLAATVQHSLKYYLSSSSEKHGETDNTHSRHEGFGDYYTSLDSDHHRTLEHARYLLYASPPGYRKPIAAIKMLVDLSESIVDTFAPAPTNMLTKTAARVVRQQPRWEPPSPKSPSEPWRTAPKFRALFPLIDFDALARLAEEEQRERATTTTTTTSTTTPTTTMTRGNSGHGEEINKEETTKSTQGGGGGGGGEVNREYASPHFQGFNFLADQTPEDAFEDLTARADALFLLAALSSSGLLSPVVPLDDRAAVQALYYAARAGSPEAHLALADRYLHGRGIPKSCHEAVRRLEEQATALAEAASLAGDHVIPPPPVSLRDRFMDNSYEWIDWKNSGQQVEFEESMADAEDPLALRSMGKFLHNHIHNHNHIHTYMGVCMHVGF